METVRLLELSLEGIGMKVHAVIERCHDNYYSDYTILDDCVYLDEEDAERVFKEKSKADKVVRDDLDTLSFDVIERPKTSVTVLSSRMGFVCLSGRNMVDEEDSQIMIGYDDVDTLIKILSTAQECQKKHVPAKWTYELCEEKQQNLNGGK